MIYLIGGPPRCGKTTLAKMLSTETGITWLSGDTLEGVVRPYVCKEDYATIFPKNILRDKTENSNDRMYKEYSTKEIIDVYMKQAEAPEYAIEVIVDNMLQEKQSIIIEGYHISPRFASYIRKKYGEENIRVVILVKSDAKKALETLKASEEKDDWVHKHTKEPETINKIADFVVEYSNVCIRESDKYNVKCLDYSNSLNKHMVEAKGYLLEV